MGYYRAGFKVIGVDINPQPRYPFQFVQADALTYPLDGATAIHASPPCQGYSEMRHAPGAKGAPLIIEQVRAKLEESGLTYVIENVDGAAWAMRDPVRLTGTMFGLGAQGCVLQRGRLFETNWPLVAPNDSGAQGRPVIGVYGGHARKRSAKAGGRGTRDVWKGGHKAVASEALGINWMTLAEMSESIPPAYTEWIGRQLINFLKT
jgi:DNA (cytosine-5)-methyltransferase 1